MTPSHAIPANKAIANSHGRLGTTAINARVAAYRVAPLFSSTSALILRRSQGRMKTLPTAPRPTAPKTIP